MSKPADAKSVFQDARDLPVAERGAFLDAACAGEPALRARVEALLAADERAGAFLASPTGGVLGDGASHERPGTVIGHYTLQQQIGEGGFGVVWMAEQRAPVRRQVALKVVKHGMDSRTVVARFEQERQALALMDHPNIAKVFDGGETPAGRPFFVMELVRGVPITTFCDEQQLDAHERLKLFVQVCHAVQHAHQKGIIHRDLKPSNVLVTLHDAAPVPKVIDFGIAKAVRQPLTEKTLFTEFRQMVGTPEYMSPEQAELSGLDIDTRADIYSLGVLLYELLTGTLPFDGRTLQQKGLLELLRMIREEEPQKPSTRVSTSGASGAAVARSRRTEPRRLGKQLRGDLDWIVMKALEKERGRRYGSADALAADVQRHLRDEPVLASPPGRVYRLRKYLRRHRSGVAAAVALACTLSAATWFAFEAYRQAGMAKVRQAESHLAAIPLWERAVADEAHLDPAEPERIPAMRAWLAAHDVLVERRASIAATLRDLESRALPATPEELERDRQQHPKAALLAGLVVDVAGERRAQAVRDGAPPTTVELTADDRAVAPMKLGQMAWERVAPDHERTHHGEEARGLALVQAVLAAPKRPDAPRHSLLDTLAWALIANGRDVEAVEASRAALAAVPADFRPDFEDKLRLVQQRVADAAGGAWLARREAELTALTAEVAARRTFRFESPADDELHAALRSLVEKIDALTNGPAIEVAKRLRWAECIDELTRAHPLAAVSWSDAAAAIAAADGERANTAYRGRGIVLTPQRGLVPIGMNPCTRLWEFYDLRSAWDGQQDPATLPIPRHEADGTIDVARTTGIVFVLLPGGDVPIGAQCDDPNAPNHDQDAVPAMGPVRVHSLVPFFLARHEMTQGQWARLWTGNPAGRRPANFGLGTNPVGNVELTTGMVNDRNPVESVDWPTCAQLLAQHALAFPTEAEWEYACRAGSPTPWSCDRAELVLHANLADDTARRFDAAWRAGFEPWDDGCLLHVRVGRFRPNAFGMHDMHGNVQEWCADGRSGTHGPNGEREPGTTHRGVCGGAFDSRADDARSAFRSQPPLQSQNATIGLRAARRLR